MNDFDIIESIKAEAKRLSVNPNALAASGLQVRVEPISYRPGFGENAFMRVAAHWYAAILPALAERQGFEVIAVIDGEAILVKQYEMA